MHKPAQIIYDNQMPIDPPEVEEWQIRDRMLSLYLKEPVKWWHSPLASASDEEQAMLKSMISQSLNHESDFVCQQIGKMIMHVVRKDLRSEAISSLEEDIDRSLGT